MKHFSELSPAAERVVDAAEGLLQQQGYNGFSYDDVAQLIGIKKPSIHHHFPAKADLATMVVQRYTHRFREELLRIEGHHARARDRLVAYAELFDRTFARERRLCVCGMLGAEAHDLPESVRDEVARFFGINLRWLQEGFELGQREGALDPAAQPEALARAYLCALEGAMVVGRGLANDQGPSTVGRAMLDLCWR
ncbi:MULTISPECIES: TetR/AcrR family transcriptional regulator [unclassified Roseateles]|uniref:TetR/AcrR family transcriptional regulator n=1 Tax=unclassified Roseateles TaxID=2626991 RepID=UPI0006FDB053|nr:MULTISPECIES: TetR/AcrR family transcriptional regulator [unclassified Roseateles]KQW51915.1 transcriptional regulator protein [Pelomonas sp. Root405]KRA78148.1 transcriptional regulator protein [Pelomonas sp. Root662]